MGWGKGVPCSLPLTSQAGLDSRTWRPGVQAAASLLSGHAALTFKNEGYTHPIFLEPKLGLKLRRGELGSRLLSLFSLVTPL